MVIKNKNASAAKPNGHIYHTIEREKSSLGKNKVNAGGGGGGEGEKEGEQEEKDNYKLRKSASFSSSSNNSLRGAFDGTTNSSSSSLLSLRSSPLRSSCRTLKTGKINTFQKWETTVESVSYVTTKTVAINEYPSDKKSKLSTTPIAITLTQEPLNGKTVKKIPIKLTNGCNDKTNGSEEEKGKFAPLFFFCSITSAMCCCMPNDRPPSYPYDTHFIQKTAAVCYY